MLDKIITNKPEYIDPDEKNLTYYYNRDKFKKRLAESNCCSDRKFFPRFDFLKNSPYGRWIFLFFLAVSISLLFSLSEKRLKEKQNLYLNNKKNSLEIGAYHWNFNSNYQKDKNKIIMIFSITNLSEKIAFFSETDLSFWITDKNNKILLEQKKKINAKKTEGLENFTVSFEFFVEEEPYKIKVLLFSNNKMQEIEEILEK